MWPGEPVARPGAVLPFHEGRNPVAVLVAMCESGNPGVNPMIPRPGKRIPSGEVWHSWSDSLCSIPMMKSLLRCACEAAEMIMRGSFSSF